MPGMQSIDGISSSLDTTSIIQAMIEAESGRLNLMGEQVAEKTSKTTSYNAVSALLLGLKAKVSALTKASTFDKFAVANSAEDYVSAAVSGGDVATGSYSISINKLAQNHQIASQGFADKDSTSIGTGSFTVQMGMSSARTLTIDSTNNTLEGLKQAINNADMGVTASIINDGTESNPYRMLLTSSKSGLDNQILITNSLSGGDEDIDFETSSFDAPETVRWTSSASSTVSLGPTASYTGSENKTYTFTVQGSGSQTVGTDEIIVNWSDGTNSGAITVSEADAEVTLGSGDGADGLTLSFGAGTMVGGDTFKVQTFSPTIQAAQDAEVSLGSASGGGSPITVTSSTNTVADLIPGVTLNLKKVTDSETPSVNLSASRDTEGLRAQIEEFINQYNQAMGRINEYLDYDSETEKAGALLGDSTMITIQSRLKMILSSTVDGIDSGMRTLADMGIRTDGTGKLKIVNQTNLTEALNENLSDVIKLFTSWGDTSDSKISLLSVGTDTEETKESGYAVNITQAATHGYLQGTSIVDPAVTPLVIDSTNNSLKLKIDGRVSDEIVLGAGSYTSMSQLVTELQNKIDADDNLADLGVVVSYVDTGSEGYLKITSGKYGSGSAVEIQAGVENSATVTLGLAQATAHEGLDVAGTINGEEAEGAGQILSGKSDSETIAGLKLRIEYSSSDVAAGIATGSVEVVKGFASKFDELLESITRSEEGLLARKSNALQKQISYTNERIEDEEERLNLRMESLYLQFWEMEKLLGEMGSTQSYLETQLAQLGNNWKFSGSSKR